MAAAAQRRGHLLVLRRERETGDILMGWIDSALREEFWISRFTIIKFKLRHTAKRRKLTSAIDV